VYTTRLWTIYAILVVETQRARGRERESERAREQESERAREQEGERARERDRERESERQGEREGPWVLGREPIVSLLWTRGRERERENPSSSFVDT